MSLKIVVVETEVNNIHLVKVGATPVLNFPNLDTAIQFAGLFARLTNGIPPPACPNAA